MEKNDPKRFDQNRVKLLPNQWYSIVQSFRAVHESISAVLCQNFKTIGRLGIQLCANEMC